jgi:lipoprotein signal peptidase
VCTHVEKATLLIDRFFSNSIVDFIDIIDTTFSRDTFLADLLVLLQTITADDVK